MSLNVKMVAFLDGLNGSCKSKKCEEGIPSLWRVGLPSIQMRGMVFFFQGCVPFLGQLSQTLPQWRLLKTTGTSWFTILET